MHDRRQIKNRRFVFNQAVFRLGGLIGLAFLIPGQAAAAAEPGLVTPKLSIPIPNLSFSQLVVQEAGAKKYIDIPWIAQYLQGIYGYVLGAVSLLAVTMLVWGGVKWLTAGGDSSQVSGAKTNIKNAIIGLVLAFASFLILSTINPDLVNFKATRVEVLARQIFDLNEYMAGAGDAQSTLSEIGISPGGSPDRPTNLKIPSSCPGRNRSYTGDGNAKFGKLTVPRNQYAICCNGRCVDDKLIAQYMAEQNRTGVPAGAMMAQIMNEAGPCAVINLFDTKSSSLNYNYGGIGCTAAQVPAGTCPHVAFTKGAFGETPKNFGSRAPVTLASCKSFNGYLQICVDACEKGPPEDYKTYDCGGQCFPIKSHASTKVGSDEVWIPSIQCSRKFSSSADFLNSHLGFVKVCLPYNDSVYKFSYCIGASTYAGVSGAKGPVLAEIIERNCLCDPATDSTGCKRNLELEQKLAEGVIKKRNLSVSKYYTKGKVNYDQVVADLAETTGGLLTGAGAAKTPQNDLQVLDESAPY